MRRVRIVGRGRAGSAFAAALASAAWEVADVLGRHDEVDGAGVGVDLVLVATPDAAVADVARLIEPHETTVVAHVAGSLGLDVLSGHRHRASIHPLVPVSSGPIGAQRLRGGIWFAVAASSALATSTAGAVVADLGGSPLDVADEHRVAYHAAACMASNHLVALLGQVERVAAEAGVPLASYLDLARATIDNVGELGPSAALTGPVARGDWRTVERHLETIDVSERAAYLALAAQARRLVDPEFDVAAGVPVDPAPQG